MPVQGGSSLASLALNTYPRSGEALRLSAFRIRCAAASSGLVLARSTFDVVGSAKGRVVAPWGVDMQQRLHAVT